MHPPFIRPFSTEVAHIAATEFFRIGVKDFTIESVFGNPDPVMAVRLGSEVTDDDDKFIGVLGAANKGNHAMAVIATVDPVKSFLSKILSIEGGFATIKLV